MPAKKVASDKGQVTSKKDSGQSRTTGSGLSAPLYDLTGKEAGRVDLPKDLFGVEVNKPLLSQALRVYLNNQKAHYASTKTRAEVRGSTRKVKPQKEQGTRHGSIKAPIFVGGGIALGPKPRKVELELPKKMKRAALISALSSKAKEGEVLVVTGLEKASGKTSQLSKFVKGLSSQSLVLVTSDKNEMLQRAASNLQKVESVQVDQLNVLKIINHKLIAFDQSLIERLSK